MNAIERAWREWIAAGDTARRGLILQTLNSMRWSYSWQSLEAALVNSRMTYPPSEAAEGIAIAAETCKRAGWNRARVRAEIR